MNFKTMKKMVEARMKDVAKARDKLDETISELEHLRENCDTAYEDLVHARDAMSELV